MASDPHIPPANDPNTPNDPDQVDPDTDEPTKKDEE